MKISTKSIGQWSLLTLLSTWGMFAFIFLAGEDNPDMPISFLLFLVIKVVALINLVACYQVGKYFNKRGWLPDLDKYFGSENYGN
ncbi:MAG: hypothetical protein IJ756_05900 [Paludibacteraceae bacterium]|nr:hypothetical protein [Paludibacteraceae bacterium]